MKIAGILLIFLFAGNALGADYPQISINKLFTKEQKQILNLERMTPKQKEVLRRKIIDSYRAGFKKGWEQGRRNNSVIETQIDGAFQGWEGETIVKLINGQIWQQSSYHYEYHYAYMPEVLIYRSGVGFKMVVDGTSEAVGVTRLK